jgi:hypothetical protein
MAKTRESSSPAVQKSRTAANQPTREEIALRAYEIFLRRGGAPGNELADWVLAERELLDQDPKQHRKPAAKSVAA